MIKTYRTEGGRPVPLDSSEDGCWINVVSPTKEEIDGLSLKFGIPRDFITDPLDTDERSRLEAEDGCRLVVLRVSEYDPRSDIPFTTLPLGVILTGEHIITVAAQETRVISDFLNGRVRKFDASKRERFLLQILSRTAIQYLRDLREINRRTTQIERELHKSMRNEELIRLLNIEKSLVYFTTSLKSNEIMMERLRVVGRIKLSEDEADLLDEVLIENKQAIEVSNVYSNILSGMMDAFASVISNNLNVVMKFLTAITIILMIPTLVASIYGMNVALPFQTSPHAFLLIAGISVLLTILGVLFFIKRRMF